jgi:hypothetical protein
MTRADPGTPAPVAVSSKLTRGCNLAAAFGALSAMGVLTLQEEWRRLYRTHPPKNQICPVACEIRKELVEGAMSATDLFEHDFHGLYTTRELDRRPAARPVSRQEIRALYDPTAKMADKGPTASGALPQRRVRP